MSTLLWMISFILHGVSLLAIYLLLKDRQHAGNSKETEAVLKETLTEIRKENKMLQRLLEEEKQPDTKTADWEEIQQTASPVAEDTEAASIKTEEKLQNPEMSPSAVYQDEVETSLEAKVLQLHANGNTTDEIAQQLNCGKIEAEIIIKMHQKKS
ncbi:DUF6115 domain-containing protein [Oceanobacillus timonensis]|uniref:DUF6115 domain-containing protein n=1 Tax=Oceanobacillus timonensis TaxID=1926285 RepID=UPI0009BAA1A8|nr:hypothetical protein [Oceanobacillus timonensis]